MKQCSHTILLPECDNKSNDVLLTGRKLSIACRKLKILCHFLKNGSKSQETDSIYPVHPRTLTMVSCRQITWLDLSTKLTFSFCSLFREDDVMRPQRGQSPSRSGPSANLSVPKWGSLKGFSSTVCVEDSQCSGNSQIGRRSQTKSHKRAVIGCHCRPSHSSWSWSWSEVKHPIAIVQSKNITLDVLLKLWNCGGDSTKLNIIIFLNVLPFCKYKSKKKKFTC